MFLLAIQLQGTAQAIIFKFKRYADAQREFEALEKATEGRGVEVRRMLIQDDYGHKRAFWPYSVENIALIDMEKDMDSQAQMAVIQARGQSQAQRAVQADPSIRLATMAGGQILQS